MTQDYYVGNGAGPVRCRCPRCPRHTSEASRAERGQNSTYLDGGAPFMRRGSGPRSTILAVPLPCSSNGNREWEAFGPAAQSMGTQSGTLPCARRGERGREGRGEGHRREKIGAEKGGVACERRAIAILLRNLVRAHFSYPSYRLLLELRADHPQSTSV